ncbi:nibrin [Calliphora vicina]|uniref:nibrin n=1 Tax=Calliphora vicina TaxID=7373 RepID=UPI00325B39D7
MWFITHTISGDSVCLLPTKLKYSVGRMGADVELQDEICVSRAHAAFHLVKSEEQYKLELEDLGSKYGTFLNQDIETNTALVKGRKIGLKNDDIIRFGRLQNIWKVQFMTIKTAISSLSREDTLLLQKYVTALGGKILDEWSSDCTHLTMTDKLITMKLLHALVGQKLVVTPTYWKDLLSAANSVRTHLPKPESYKPDFDDDDINLNCNAKRRLLFKGYTFVFLNRKHFETYSPIIRSAGGICKDLNSGVQKAFLIKDKVVVVEYTPSTQTQSSQTISTIADFLESNSKRIIPEYEIGFAILRCSMKIFCNPCYKMPNTTPALFPSEMSNDSNRIDLTEEQSTPSLNTESMDLVISETNENMVTSTPFINAGNTNPSPNKEEQSTLNTPVENQRKRKVMSVDLNESDEEDLFKFESKKTCNKKDDNGEKEQVVKTVEAKSTVVEPIKKQLNTTNVFLQKSQNKTQISLNQTEEQPSTSKENRKRPLIQVLNEEDEGNDDDLFSFGDTQKKKARKENDEEDDLFSFKEKEGTTTKKPIRTIELDEDSNDMEPTQQFIVVTKKASIQMPKPKIIPRKISAIEWISGSLGKINIKKENSAVEKNENEDENMVKTESEIKSELDAENTITEDHRKWLESLKDAIEIQQISLNNTIKSVEKSHYKFKNRSNNTADNLNETIPNFKRFVKKYHVPSQNNSIAIKLHLR